MVTSLVRIKDKAFQKDQRMVPERPPGYGMILRRTDLLPALNRNMYRYIMTTKPSTTRLELKQVSRPIIHLPLRLHLIYFLPAVTFQLCRDNKGLTWDLYQKGIEHWRRVHKLTIPSNPAAPPQRKLIGYS